jgi:hypothetical protein
VFALCGVRQDAHCAGWQCIGPLGSCSPLVAQLDPIAAA